MKQKLGLGSFEHDVLMAVFRCGDDAYTLTIRNELDARIDKAPALGAIHATLARLEERGLVKTRTGPTSPQRRGRPKKLFCLTGVGREALAEAHRKHMELWSGIDIDLGMAQ